MEGLKDIDIYNELEGDLNYNKVFNCFRVDINSRQRFVGISTQKENVIPSILHKDELSIRQRNFGENFVILTK